MDQIPQGEVNNIYSKWLQQQPTIDPQFPSTSAFAAGWIKSSHKKYVSWLRLSCLPVTLPNGTDGPCWLARALLNMINPQNWSDCNTKYIIISVKGEPRAMIQHDCPDSTLCRTPKVTTSSIDFKGSLWEVQPTLFKCIYIYIYSSWSCTIWAIGSFLVNVFFTLQLVWITQQKTLKINATLASGPQLLPSRSHLAILGPAGRRTPLNTQKVAGHSTSYKILKVPKLYINIKCTTIMIYLWYIIYICLIDNLSHIELSNSSEPVWTAGDPSAVVVGS